MRFKGYQPDSKNGRLDKNNPPKQTKVPTIQIKTTRTKIEIDKLKIMLECEEKAKYFFMYANPFLNEGYFFDEKTMQVRLVTSMVEWLAFYNEFNK